MPTPTGPTDPNVKNLIIELRKTKANVWKKVSEQLSKPRRNRPEVNLDKINRYAPNNSVVAIPGKVLGRGNLNKKVTIIALSASDSALQKISSSGSKFISLNEYLKKNPKGKGVLLMK
ncbi:MAG: 50S ribosomal protein L18e [Candidatus Odinarchaeia archaeon]